MNERIRALALQAGIKITPMVVDGVEYEYEDVEMDGSEDLAKFVESIVRECVDVIKWTPALYPNDRIIENIKEHFEVDI